MTLPIGFFSPLPLAMMIPFMATQSLAMGEAFGKSFQYGKRKISSMTNEEFNKYSFSNMMDEQTANIKMMIPKLHEQMHESEKLQKQIFEEMVKLLPLFLNTIINAITESTKTGNENYLPFIGEITEPDIVQASYTAPPTNISIETPGTTITPPPPPEIETPQDIRIKYRNSISHFNQYSLNQELKRFGITNTEKSIVMELLKKYETPTQSTPPPEQQPLTSQQSQQKDYLTKTINFQKLILDAKAQEITAENTYNGYKNSATARTPQVTAFGAVLGIKQKATARAIKNLQNFILLSRNNLSLKSVANPDWNNRIWKM